MDIIIDANILFSILIKKGKNEEILFEEDLHILAPEFIFQEFDKYRNVLLDKTSRSKKEFNELLNLLKKKIETIPNEETDKFMITAKRICPDEKDVDYFALALKFRCPVWSNDKELKEKQDVVKVYSTEDVMKLLGI